MTVSTRASRSGATYSRTVRTTSSSNGKPRWMIGARSGHATATSVTCGSTAASASAYAPLATVAVVASRPIRPLRVAATAATASGRTTASTSMPSVVSIIRRRSAGSAAAVAVLHATTRSFTDRAMSSSAISTQKRSSSPGERSPYGKRAVSPRYTKSSCGSETSSSWSTVSPPTPESKTPMGRARYAAGGAGTAPMVGAVPGGSRGARGKAEASAGLLADAVDGVLQLVGHLLGDRAALGRVRRGGHDRAHHHRDQQDQRDVLDRALPRLGPQPIARQHERGVRAAHHPVAHLGPSLHPIAGTGSESAEGRVTAKEPVCEESRANACPDRDKHVAQRRGPRARQLRARPGRRAAGDAGRRRRGLRVPTARLRARRPRPAAALPARALRRRPRPLRAHRLAGARRAPRHAGRHAPRHRPAPSAVAPHHLRRAAALRPRGRRLTRARPRGPGRAD